jgi:hypothetical protein
VIIVDRPPNFDQILAAFPDADKPGVIFAYGEHVYNPSGGEIPAALLAHESVHCARQHRFSYNLDREMTPELWWEQYLTSPEFRYQEELLAHVVEYKVQVGDLDRNMRTVLLHSTARRLVAPLYNYQPPRTMQDALRDLWKELDR